MYWTLTFIFTVQTVPGPLAITSTRAYHNEPDRPFQEVVADFCSYAGWEFLILVDCYTDWPDEVFITTTPRLVTAPFVALVCLIYVPDILWSNQGPQFTSHVFQAFAAEWGFKHMTSTPTHPQSNDKIEATVKSMKKIIQASWTGSMFG